MSLRINQNTASLNAHRNLVQSNAKVSKSLERLSSGLTINRAGDGPASLVASEQLRAQIASIDQAIQNSETSVSMVQTAEGALNEVNNLMVSMRQLAIHAANEGANDDVMLAADQMEITNMVEAVDRIAKTTEFGSKKLLDGSNGVSGSAMGSGLQYIGANISTVSSGDKGFDVVVTQAATQSSIMGKAALTDELVKAGETLTVSEGGKVATYTTSSFDTMQSAAQNFATAADKAGLDVQVELGAGNMLEIRHNQFGSGYDFQASSSTTGVLSTQAGEFDAAVSGSDIKGKINGEATTGRGDIMTGIAGNANTEGLMVRYRGTPGEEIPEAGKSVGMVSVTQNALTFQVGPGQGQTVNIALQNTASSQLARGVDNTSSFKSLSEIDVTFAQGAQDSMKLIDTAVNEVSKLRSQLGSFQKNTLETNVANLRTAGENMTAAESSIRDTDIAKEMAEFTRNDLMMQSGAAMLAQANQIPKKVLTLLVD